MAVSTKFSDSGQTPVCADWLNTVDDLVYSIFDEAETVVDAIAALDVAEEAPIDGFGYARKDGGWTKAMDLSELQALALYLGSAASDPSAGFLGAPLVEGNYYYNTTLGVGRVYTGAYWRSLITSVFGATYDIWIKDVSAAGSVDVSVADGRGGTIDLTTGATVHVYVDGVKLAPYDAADGLGDFTWSAATDTVTFQANQTGVCVVEQYQDAGDIVSNIANQWLMTLTPAPDSVETEFTMKDSSATDLNISDNAHVVVFVDGVRQKPGTDYTASGATLTMTEPPLSDSDFWGLWIDADGTV